MEDIYPDNLHQGDGEDERFEDEDSVEDVTPVAANPFDAIATVPALPSQSNVSNNQFDPFAPQDVQAGGGNLLDNFVEDAANTNDNSANVDLLSGVATTTTTENDKQGTDKDSVWWQLDAVKDENNNSDQEEEEEVLMGTPKETTDQFVDESAKEDTTTATGGGFFSRMRDLISSADEGSGMQPIVNTNAENLEHGGNSLPHPDSLKHGASGDYLEEEHDDESENSSDDDDEHGSSLPHPQEILRSENHRDPEGVKLDENGLSLPHPESVLLENDDHENDTNDRLIEALDAASADSDSDMIDVTSDSDSDSDSEEEYENYYREHSSSGSSSASGPYLDKYGNSLPHPDEHNFAARPTMKWGNLKKSIQSFVSKNNDESMKEIDLETGSRAESDSESDSDSDFDDENNTSTKANLRRFIEEHRDNPRSRLICYSSLALLLLLIIVIPVSNRSKSKPLDTTASPVATQAPSITFDNHDCIDEIVLTDRNGNDLVNGTSTSDDVACYTMDEPIHFRFKRCRPASPLDWVGVFPARSMFMERLWKDHYDGVYLCGDQPCPTDDPLNQKGGPPRAKTLKAPPIQEAGEYRLFLVKDSAWPYEYVDLTPSFAVVDQKIACLDRDNIFNEPASSKPGFAPDKNAESIYIQTPTVVPTGIGTPYMTESDSVSASGFR